MKFDKVFNRLILEQTEDQNMKKMHQIYLKAMDNEDIAQKKWQNALKRKRLCICVKDQKTKLVKISSFNKKADRYIKYAQQFIQQSQDEDIDEKDVDNMLKTVQQRFKQIQKKVSEKKENPKEAAKQIKNIYNKVKKRNKKAAQKIKPAVQKEIKVTFKKLWGAAPALQSDKKEIKLDKNSLRLVVSQLSDKNTVQKYTDTLNEYKESTDDKTANLVQSIIKVVSNLDRFKGNLAIGNLTKIFKKLIELQEGKRFCDEMISIANDSDSSNDGSKQLDSTKDTSTYLSSVPESKKKKRSLRW